NAKTGFTINVNAGTLNYAQNDANVGAGTAQYAGVKVNNGGTLSGTGNLNGPVTVYSGGTIHAGASPGVMSVGNLTLSSGSFSNFDLQAYNATPPAGIGANSTYSRLIGITNVTFGGTLNVSTYSGGPTFAAGQIYDLYDWSGTHSGSFSSISLPTLSSNLKWHDYGSGVDFDYTTGQIEVDNATQGTTYTLAALANSSSSINVRVGATPTIAVTVTNTGLISNNADTLTYTNLAVNQTGVGGSLAALSRTSDSNISNNSGTSQATATFTASTAGQTVLTPAIPAANATNSALGTQATFTSPATAATVTAYDYAQPALAAVAFSNVHVGATSSLSVTNPVLHTVTGGPFQDSVDGSVSGTATSNSAVTVNNPTSFNVAAGGAANTSIVFTAAGAGSLTASKTITLTDNANGVTGLSGGQDLSLSASITGTAYSGQSTWIGSSGGSWGTLASSFGANWGTNQGSPGLDAGFTGVDTAAFGNTSGSVTVNLDGATPNLNAVTFNGTGNYTLAPGSGGTLTMAGSNPIITAAGTQVISAPLILASNLTASVTNSSDMLSVNGDISETVGGPKSLTKSGLGTLTLAGVDTYTGGTSVAAGLLVINNSAALPSGSVLAIGAGASVVLGDPPAAGSGQPAGGLLPGLAAAPASSGPTLGGGMASVHAVPEPGTMALLAAGLACGVVLALRRRGRKGI
ncbi:MAG: autotransporter-associated beta strand repeat-containing protein, partial [Tepidisphaeraceae bacterium]